MNFTCILYMAMFLSAFSSLGAHAMNKKRRLSEKKEQQVETALFKAVNRQDKKAIAGLIEGGESINYQKNRFCWTPLHKAIFDGKQKLFDDSCIAFIAWLLDQGLALILKIRWAIRPVIWLRIRKIHD